jgi:hypothetical protein
MVTGDINQAIRPGHGKRSPVRRGKTISLPESRKHNRIDSGRPGSNPIIQPIEIAQTGDDKIMRKISGGTNPRADFICSPGTIIKQQSNGHEYEGCQVLFPLLGNLPGSPTGKDSKGGLICSEITIQPW